MGARLTWSKRFTAPGAVARSSTLPVSDICRPFTSSSRLDDVPWSTVNRSTIIWLKRIPVQLRAGVVEDEPADRWQVTEHGPLRPGRDVLAAADVARSRGLLRLMGRHKLQTRAAPALFAWNPVRSTAPPERRTSWSPCLVLVVAGAGGILAPCHSPWTSQAVKRARGRGQAPPGRRRAAQPLVE